MDTTTEPPDPFEARDLIVAEQSPDVLATEIRRLVAGGLPVHALLAEIPTLSESQVRAALGRSN